MSNQSRQWASNAVSFLLDQVSSFGASSVPNGPVTLYGTCYALLGLHYLDCSSIILENAFKQLLVDTYDPSSGLYNGPELLNFKPAEGALHDKRHLQLHLACSAVLPVAQQVGFSLPPLSCAYRYCNISFLRDWCRSIDWVNAWFEGNNILFVGQMLIYLRDVERHPGADDALRLWFEWLDSMADISTGLWGTDGYCSIVEAVYGGYHQLLVYYYENHPLPNTRGLVDAVLSLQHADGGFNPNGNGGACEDVDSVDILVNCYKRVDYRRPEIRFALRRCLHHILLTQNQDGGFPYNLNQPQSHMGIPGTEAAPNVSCTFPTWFRIHTLALISEVLPNAPQFRDLSFNFNRALSMGWHSSPTSWDKLSVHITLCERLIDGRMRLKQGVSLLKQLSKHVRRKVIIGVKEIQLINYR